MKDQIAEILKAIADCDLPADFGTLLGGCYDYTEGCFEVQETSILDYKERFPDPDDKDYISGILKLIIAFHNNYGGVIIFGVRNDDFKAVGVNGHFDIEKFNSLTRDIFSVNAELIRRDYIIESPTRCRITVLLIPKRENVAPVEAKRDYFQIKLGDLYIRDRHEALSASDRHLSQLFSHRKFYQSSELPISVHVSLPPSPSTLPKYIGRFGLMKQLWTWFVFGRGPRIYLSGPGGSGKSTLAYEFAERIALIAQDIRLGNGEFLDYVLYLSAKETELNVKKAIEQPFQMRQFKNSTEELGAILSNSGLQSDEQISRLDYEQRLSGLDELFDNFNGLIVIDDIDALIRAGIDTGEEELFLKISKSKKCTKIIYTLRNDASYAKNSSIPVPGLAKERELPGFVDACCELFGVLPPDAKQEGTIATETSSLPLLVETIIGLRKNSSSYEEAIRDFKEKGGDEARRYLYQREYDRLTIGGKSKQILATMMEYNGALGFDAVCTLAASSPEQTRLAINETANIFLKIATDEFGVTSYSLSPSARPFIRSASLGFPTPKSSATCCRESPLVSAIRTASLRNSSVLPVPMSHLLCCTLRYQRSGTKPRQVQFARSSNLVSSNEIAPKITAVCKLWQRLIASSMSDEFLAPRENASISS